MLSIGLLLACFVGGGDGRQVPSPIQFTARKPAWSHQLQESIMAMPSLHALAEAMRLDGHRMVGEVLHPWKVLAALFLAFTPAAAFSPCTSKLRPASEVHPTVFDGQISVAKPDSFANAECNLKKRGPSMYPPSRGSGRVVLQDGGGTASSTSSVTEKRFVGKILALDDSRRVKLDARLGSGSYGEVYAGKMLSLLSDSDGVPLDVVAKLSHARKSEDAAEAERFFEAEAIANSIVMGFPGVCTFLGEASSDDGTRFLIFERIFALDGSDGPPNSCADLLEPEHSSVPLAPREVLRHLLTTLAPIHDAGILHRDIKLENLLLDPALQNRSSSGAPSMKLIDFGSAISVEGCSTLFDRMLQKCEIVKPKTWPNTKLYRAPEKRADIEHPFSYDIFAAGICFLRLAWVGMVDDYRGLTLFRNQLQAADGDLEQWLRTQLSFTVVSQTMLDCLERFPGDDSVAFAAVRSMLNPDPAKRPSAAALLAHPFFATVPKVLNAEDQKETWSSLQALFEPECRLPGYNVVERPLAISVRLAKPLSLVMREVPLSEGGGLFISEILPSASGAAYGQLHVGDHLVALGETSLLGTSYKQAMTAINAADGPRGTIQLLFERACVDPEACELPEEQVSGGAGARDIMPLVRDSGSFASIGGRKLMEDTHVVTSFTADTAAGPQSFILAAVFDGHRGGAASAHAAEKLPAEVSAAIAEAEPAPLAVAWRRIVDSYLEKGNQDGSTASAILVSDTGIAEILNCGDSRTVVTSASASVLYATRDHSASSADEIDRIQASGGLVDCTVGSTMRVAVNAPSAGEGTVFRVAIARSLGGSEWVAGQISNAADMTTLDLPADASEVIIATDGLWGVLPDGPQGSAEASEFVHRARLRGLGAGKVAQRLVSLARKRGSMDNCVTVVLYLG